MKEIIKRFDNTKIYVSNYGKAYKYEKGCIVEMPATKTTAGKLAISIGSGLGGRMNIDSLVWRTFNGNPEGLKKLYINHIDGNPDNNRLDNLEMPQHQKKEKIEISADKYNDLLKRIAILEANQDKQITMRID